MNDPYAGLGIEEKVKQEDPYAGLGIEENPVSADPYTGLGVEEKVTPSDPYAGLGVEDAPSASLRAGKPADPYAGLGVEETKPVDPYAGLGVEDNPAPVATIPRLKREGVGWDIARTATSAGGMLAEKGAQIVRGLEDTAQSVIGLPRAIRDKAFTYLWQAFPDQMQKFQESRQPAQTQPLEESKLQQVKGQGELAANEFMNAVEQTHAEALDEIHKQGGIPAYVAQKIGEGALSLAIDLALLHKVTGAQPAELTGSSDLMRQAAVQNAKASAAVYASTPGTPEDKLNAAMHSVVIMGTPTAAAQLPRQWMAKTAAILANAGLNTEAYMNGLQEAHRMAEQNGNPADWPKYAVSTLGVQAMTDFMFGILTRARQGDPTAREVLNEPETRRLQEEISGQKSAVSANPEQRMTEEARAAAMARGELPFEPTTLAGTVISAPLVEPAQSKQPPGAGRPGGEPAAQGIPVNQVAVLTALQQGKQVGRPTLTAIANRMSQSVGESPKQILNDLMLAHGHSSVKLIQNLEKELRAQDGGKNAKQIRELVRNKAETLRAILGGGTGTQSERPSNAVLAGGVRTGQETVQGISPVVQSGAGPGEPGQSRSVLEQQARSETETARGIVPRSNPPQNKADLDKFYPGLKIQIIDHPALRRGSGQTGGITYLHKDMTPEMRADWLARPESRGGRAAQAAGLDTFMQEVAARGGGKMRGFAERMSESETLSPEQAAAVRANPENYYEPQSYREMNERLNRMSDDELAVARDTPPTSDGQENNSVKAGLELFNRKLARGQDVQPDVEAMSKKGTTLGQGLRQYGDLKTSTPAGQLMMIEIDLHRQGRKLTGAQHERFKSFVDADFKAREIFRASERILEHDFTDVNARKADEMENLANAANRRLVAAVRDASSLSISRMLTQALQGNLLRLGSQMKNITGNLFLLPLRAGEQAIGAALDKVESLFTGGRRTTLSPTVGAWAARKGAWQGVKAASSQFIGKKTQDRIIGEAMQGFRPLRAAVQAWTGEGMAVTREGKIAKIDRLKKGLEAALGAAPEPMLRLLSFGDLPFSAAERVRGLVEQGRLRGLKGEELQKFIRFPDAKALEIVDKSAREAVYQQENKLAKWISSGMKEMGAFEIVGRTIMPYVKTPSNIMTVVMRYAVPPVPLIEGIAAAIKGNRREANLKIGQAVIGTIMNVAGAYLMSKGIIMGDPDKDAKRRGVQYGYGAPNSINISALARLKRGESTEPREGDEWRSFQYLGPFGVILTIWANSGEAWQRTRDRAGVPLDQRVGDFAGQVATEVLPQTGSAVFNLSVLKGTSALLDAVANNKYDGWAKSWFQAASSIVLPSVPAELNRIRQDYLPEMRGDNWKESFANVVKEKLFQTDNMPLKRDLFGRPIRGTPEGVNSFIWNVIDVTKPRQTPNDPLMREIYQVYSATRDPDAIPSVPARTIMMPADLRTRTPPVRRELTVREYERYQELVGQARSEMAQKHLLSMNQYQRADDDKKADMLKKAWALGAERGKIQFVHELLGLPMRGIPPPFRAGNK